MQMEPEAGEQIWSGSLPRGEIVLIKDVGVVSGGVQAARRRQDMHTGDSGPG